MPRLPAGTVAAKAQGGVYLGIDPGASGGLACIALDNVEAVPMPESDRDLWDWFRWFMPGMKPFALVEKVGGYIGGNPVPGSAMFNFGTNYGKLLMALTAAGIPFETVTPQRWQKGLSIPPRKKGEGKTAWKNRLKVVAQRLFPDVKVTLATADALLIAEHCRRSRERKD